MRIPEVESVTSAVQAQKLAVDWQHWMSSQRMSQDEYDQWEKLFITLGEKFDLTEEFKENGII